MDRADKPADIEAAGEIASGRAPRHQDNVAVPDRLELGLRHCFGPGRHWALNHQLVVDDSGRGSGSRRRAAATMPGSGVTASLLQLVFCARALSPNSLAQRRISVTPNSRRAHAMPDLFRVGRNAMATQQDRYGHEPRSSPLSSSVLAISRLRILAGWTGISLRSTEAAYPINVSRACVIGVAGPRSRR